MTTAAAQPRVAYIMGRSRSGSTLLGNALASIDGFVHAGELRRFWSHAAGASDPLEIPCGCGQSFNDCDFWFAVRTRLRSEPVVPDAAVVAGWQRRLTRPRQFLHLAHRARRPASEPLASLAAATRCLYSAVADVAGARVVVDTSKSPAAALVAAQTQLPLLVVHLVRDPRAVTFSWAKRVSWPTAAGEMKRYHSAASVLRWDAYNLMSEYVARRLGPSHSTVVRYEDLAAAPGQTIRAILELDSGRNGNPPLVKRDEEIHLRGGHGLGGNPSKLKTGVVRVRLDDAWLSEMPRRQLWTGTALALPLLRRYGYPFRPPRG